MATEHQPRGEETVANYGLRRRLFIQTRLLFFSAAT